MRVLLLSLVFTIAGFVSVNAQSFSDDDQDFVRANTVFFIYHELGHALIDKLRLPVFGQEEDAADVLGIVLSETINSEDDNAWIAASAAEGFAIMAAIAEEEGYELAFWDLHGLDLQRYFTLICLHYGADPEGRQSLADDFGLPEDRQITCGEEFALAEESWGPVIEEISGTSGSDWLKLVEKSAPETPVEEVVYSAVEEEVSILNEALSPDFRMEIIVTHCGEANAFYDPNRGEITICAEIGQLFIE